MTKIARQIAAVCAAAAFALGAGAVFAQSADDVVLHEYFNPWDVRSSAGSAEGPAEGARPAQNEERIAPGEPPGLSVNPTADEVIFGADGPVDRGSTAEPYGPLEPRSQASSLDENTDRVDQLNYFANFEPSVIPYKRGVVQNAARYDSGDYAVTLRSHKNRRVRVDAGKARQDEDVFWGSFLLRADRGKLHPIPSVAPSQRILEVQAEPDVPVSFERDEADNFYVRPDSEGVLRLNIKIAAPKSYFGGPLARQVSWSDLSSSATPGLPQGAAAVAGRVLEGLGISQNMRPIDALEALVEHYRDFEGRALPSHMADQDLYETLSREQIGVCRHRSLAFLISARALGIPTRYVYNEAHAFVEVLWPQTGWRRIDLGGAADELSYTGRAGSSTHDAGDDALPQPPNYVAEMERMDTQGGSDGDTGDGANERSDADEALAESTGSGESGDGSAHGEQTGEHGDEQALPGQSEGDDGSEAEHAHQMSEPDAQPSDAADALADMPDGEPQERREKVVIDVQADAIEVFRGNTLGLHGSLFTRSGQPLTRREISVHLGRVGGHSEEGLIELGTLETDSSGRFQGELAIPEEVSIGRWSVILSFAGDDEYRPARAE